MNSDFQSQQPSESGFCAQCGTSNARSAGFCAKCGALLPWAAPKAETIPVAPDVAPVSVTAPIPPPPQAAPPPAAVPEWMPRLGKMLFPRELLTAYKGATPQELLRLYGPRLVGLVLLVLAFKSFAETIFNLLILGTLVGILVGLKNPEKFRFLFGAQTSKSTVGWSFGTLLILLGMIGSSLEPKRENTNPATTRVASQPVGKAQSNQEPYQISPSKPTRGERFAKAPTPTFDPTVAPTSTPIFVPAAKAVPLNLPRNEEGVFPDLYRVAPGEANTSEANNLRGRVKQVTVVKTSGGQSELHLARVWLFRPDGKIERDVWFKSTKKSADPVIGSNVEYEYDLQGQLFHEETYDGDPQDGGKKTSETL